MGQLKDRIHPAQLGLSLGAPLAALAIAAVISSILLLVTGYAPATVLSTLGGRLGETNTLYDSLNRAIPLYLSATAVAIGFKMNLFNIGVEGQYKVGALAAALAGAYTNLPAPLHILLCLVAAMVAGGLWATVPAVLKVKRGINEVVSTIMLNFIAISLVAWLYTGVFKDSAKGDLNTKTKIMPKSAWMPDLLTSGSHMVNSFIIIAGAVGVGFYLLVWKSRFGFQLRASGQNAFAARTSGVDPKRMIVAAMVLSGALGGLVGLPELLGDKHAYTDTFSVGLGFDGIAVALLGRKHPLGMALAAVVWGFLDAAGRFLDLEGIPREIVTIMQGVIVLAVVIVYQVAEQISERRVAAAAAERLEIVAAAA
ncbi:MAG TPA: sugar ABC transporter permease [Acidimicrobiaceae bacterium]|jgi:ABC-type uncharacterized transport system permease subunit|nr:sugar ABC transporter permease [Acidimicrobiaceae bacterium]